MLFVVRDVRAFKDHELHLPKLKEAQLDSLLSPPGKRGPCFETKSPKLYRPEALNPESSLVQSLHPAVWHSPACLPTRGYSMWSFAPLSDQLDSKELDWCHGSCTRR